ncbi:MAG: 16S rRNA processing protein RimM [Oscillospiraceae bacterium]|nr:16S rRNA processing protein RimM [Oscillospiraceae bacterium]
MASQFLEAGVVNGTHGVRGEIRITPWGDSPDFLCGFDTFYIDGKPVKVRSARPNKTLVLAALEGCDTVEQAMRYKGKVVSIDRTGVKLPEGRHFVADLIGLPVLNAATGAELGRLEEVLDLPAQNVYVVRGEGKAYMIPAVPAFLAETAPEKGYIKVNLIEGLETDV